MDNDSQQEIDSLDLPGRPTSENCIAWGADHLAVATGESIHVIASKETPANGHPARQQRWIVDTVRVNLFSLSEWPERDLVSIQNASIGEEQSESTVVALEWSAPGLGIHRRSVLTVLTSNLKLSFWESNGTIGQWTRTLIVNQVLQEAQKDHELGKLTPEHARGFRIRAFTWLTPLPTISTNKWGLHYLALANDGDEVVICSVQKTQRDLPGCWDLRVAWQGKVLAPPPSIETDLRESQLEYNIRVRSPITSLSHSGWPTQATVDTLALDENWIYSDLDVVRGNSQKPATRLSFRIPLHNDSVPVVITNDHDQRLQKERTKDRFRNELGNLAKHEKSPQFIANMPNKPWYRDITFWEPALREKIAAYNEAYNLCDFYRVRFWGVAYSTELNLISTYVTLHPLDMFEYTTPATEKTIVAFKKFLNDFETNVPSACGPSQLSTRKDEIIVNFLDQKANLTDKHSEIDAKVLRTWKIRVQKLQIAGNNVLHDVSGISGRHKEPPGGGQSFGVLSTPATLTGIQMCEACNSPFEYDFLSEATIARCRTGHAFVCCPLSLIALQEPGISKYCSKCDRAYLNSIAFQSSVESSLIQTLFDEFDTCTLCGGKFRG